MLYKKQGIKFPKHKISDIVRYKGKIHQAMLLTREIIQNKYPKRKLISKNNFQAKSFDSKRISDNCNQSNAFSEGIYLKKNPMKTSI